MIFSCNECIDKDNDLMCFSGKKVALYGLGDMGKDYFKSHENAIDILIDNYLSEKEYNGNHIYTLEEFMSDVFSSNYIVLICAGRSISALIRSLNSRLVIGKNVFIVCKFSFSSIKQFADYVNNNQHYHLSSSDGEVLIPIISGDRDPIMHYYLIRYLERKYKSKVVAYDAFYKTEFNEQIICNEIVELYKTMGVSDVVDCELSSEQMLKAQNIYDNNINKIHEFKDWKSLFVDNECIAEQIILEYLRYYPLSLDPQSEDAKRCVLTVIERVVFWHDYFETHKVKCLITSDGVIQERCIANIAVQKNIPSYIFSISDVKKIGKDFCYEDLDESYKSLFEQLSVEEQKSCKEWGAKQLDKLWNGDQDVVLDYREGFENIFSSKEKYTLPEVNGKIGVLILPHIFDEVCCVKKQLFGGNYIEWLLFLGEMSKSTNYNWYIKIHPDENGRGEKFYDLFLKRYKNIVRIPKNISPRAFLNTDIRFVLTMRGSAGHEYPYVGINVINAGNNPHISFDYNINPRSIDEYKATIENLESIEYQPNMEELIAFFGFQAQFLERLPIKLKDELFDLWYTDDGDGYKDFLCFINEDNNKKIELIINNLFSTIDNWDNSILHRKRNRLVSGT